MVCGSATSFVGYQGRCHHLLRRGDLAAQIRTRKVLVAMSKVRFLGLDVHADTIAAAEPDGEVRPFRSPAEEYQERRARSL